ncbi:hypothetical protein BHE74_00021354 [Ensete ventricosum]|nr:hypothetical protein GW17_00032614 [Ensete ventricosum]RWW70950.1 hypothetical protein BHE74_00021354 [Ensete ventricosum]RZR99957.1 hypothetical protein BHM03_00029597 [Ensete ventricosum]
MALNSKLVVVLALLLLLMLPAAVVSSARTAAALTAAMKRVPPSGPSNKGHGAPRRSSSARHLLRLHSHELHVGNGMEVRELRVASADA